MTAGGRERLWALVMSNYAAYEEYARLIREAREIPLAVLTPGTSMNSGLSS